MLNKRNKLTKTELKLINAYWRAANYLSVGQIYLRDNPLLRRPLRLADIKKTLLGHWGTTPGQNFIYVHLNRVIKKFDLNMLLISGPGHGGPAITSNVYLEGTFSEFYPEVSPNEEGIKKLFQMFSAPGGLSSHVSPQIPGSIHEGGELGYSLSHAFGAVFDNPDLIVACIIGDGEAETGPLATAWHSNKFINPITDGAVLPILHLNGYKISNPTILARISRAELQKLLEGYGYHPYFVCGEDPMTMHQEFAKVLEKVVNQIKNIQHQARNNSNPSRPSWPVIVLQTPKGWTGPKKINGKQIEDNFLSHQVPVQVDEANINNLQILEKWLKSYHPEELFDEKGSLLPELSTLIPKNEKRMGVNPHANGGKLLLELRLPDFRDFAIRVDRIGKRKFSNTLVLAEYLKIVLRLNQKQRNFRIFGPDETVSNKLGEVLKVSGRQWNLPILKNDEYLAPSGAVLDSMLSEHQIQGWLEGYLLTGRHGLLNSYEAFIRIIDSMVNQYAKWLKMSSELSWRREIASLNYLLTSHVWRQDHNGFTHQDPGFIDHLVNKKAEIVRIYLPPDANCLLSTIDHCLRSRNYINLVIADKHPSLQWLNMEQAIQHCTAGISIWDWAGNCSADENPDIVLVAAGDIPTLEIMAAADILKNALPDLRIRVVNVVDLMKLQPSSEHPHGLSDSDYDQIFTKDQEIIFAFHGYPWLIHRLVYRRHNRNIHVRGYKEEGSITTAFDMTVLNQMDRYNLVIDVIKRLELKSSSANKLKIKMEKKLIEHHNYILEHGIDMPEIRNWQWKGN